MYSIPKTENGKLNPEKTESFEVVNAKTGRYSYSCSTPQNILKNTSIYLKKSKD